MKVIVETIYVADDGSRWPDSEKALARDVLYADISAIMSRLPACPTSCAFKNGGGYIQHDPVTVDAVRKDLFDYCASRGLFEGWHGLWNSEVSPRWNIGPDWFARWFDAGGPISDAYGRLWCFNFTSYREYGQPYYASHESECPNEWVDEEVRRR